MENGRERTERGNRAENIDTGRIRTRKRKIRREFGTII